MSRLSRLCEVTGTTDTERAFVLRGSMATNPCEPHKELTVSIMTCSETPPAVKRTEL